MESTKFENEEQNVDVPEDDSTDQDLMTTYDTIAGGNIHFYK